MAKNVDKAEAERQAQIDENAFIAEDDPSIIERIQEKTIQTLLKDAARREEREQERKENEMDRKMREAAKNFNEGGMLLKYNQGGLFDDMYEPMAPASMGKPASMAPTGKPDQPSSDTSSSLLSDAMRGGKQALKNTGDVVRDATDVGKKAAKGVGKVFEGTAKVAKKGLGKMGGSLGFSSDQPDISFAEGGSMLVPPEMEMPANREMPVDTYPNIPPDEMAEAEASQLPDQQMENNYLEYVLDESLDESDQEYLMTVLENDERLSSIFDKVMDVAGEFSGEGAVEGPGTGVSDSIPARLSDGEFVFTKKATDQIGADQLQTMMDEAEMAYDGGYMKKAFGGLTLDPMQDEKMYGAEQMNTTQNELRKQMLGANRMPSVLP